MVAVRSIQPVYDRAIEIDFDSFLVAELNPRQRKTGDKSVTTAPVSQNIDEFMAPADTAPVSSVNLTQNQAAAG